MCTGGGKSPLLVTLPALLYDARGMQNVASGVLLFCENSKKKWKMENGKWKIHTRPRPVGAPPLT